MNKRYQKYRNIFSPLRIAIITILICLLIYGPLIGITQENYAVAGDDGIVSENNIDLLSESLQDIHKQKADLTLTQTKIDMDILSVLGEVEEVGSTATMSAEGTLDNLHTTNTVPYLVKTNSSGDIEVKLDVSGVDEGRLEELKKLGLNITIVLPEYGTIEGWLSYDQVEAIADLGYVTHVGTPGYPITYSGAVMSQGDTVLKADLARETFGVDGSGIKIGVISDGVTHLADSVASGDLPSSPAVSVLKDGSGDEGTAMLEIIHDLAPGAQLAFYSPQTSSDMVWGIRELRNAGCNIIVDDLIFSNEPKFEDGPIALEASAFISGGGVYVSACGNEAKTHYYNTYQRYPLPGGGGNTYVHDYGNGDLYNTFTLAEGQSITALVQWNDQWGHSANDFDIYLFRSNGSQVAVSANLQNGTGNPYEGFQYTNSGESDTFLILILEDTLTSDPSSLIIDCHIWNSNILEYYTVGNSIIGHAAVEEVLSTAAVNSAEPDIIEPFSSQGPGTICFPTTQMRMVPNITGVDGVDTYTGQMGHFNNPFYGTSAAAPHVAAIAALVWDADPTLTSAEIRNILTTNSKDLGSTGVDCVYGWGLVDAYKAIDATPLAVTVNQATDQADPTNSSTINFTADFGRPVVDFTNDDVTLNGTAGATIANVTGSATTYTIAVSGMSVDGTVIASIDAERVHDAVGNGNTVSTSTDNVVKYDIVSPAVILTTTAPNPTKITPIPVTATFNKEVTDFVVGDITVGNCTATNFVSISSKVFTFEIIPSNQGSVTVDIAAGVAHDGAGNYNIAATQLIIIYDNVSPTVTLTSVAPGSTKTSPIPVTATFSEAVSGFTVGDITLSSGTISNFIAVNSAVYTFEITPTSQGLVTVDILAGVAQDSAGNGNTAATRLSRTYDSVSPLVILTSTATNQTKLSPFSVTATFSEPVSGFEIGDIVVGNGTTSTFVAVSTTVYIFNVIPAGQGVVTIDIAAGVAQDNVGNLNTAAVRLNRTYDTVSPTVTLTSTAPNLTKTSPIPFTATFNEAVTDFILGDITVVNGTVSSFGAANATVYNFSVTPVGQSMVTVDIRADVAQDGAGNWNTASNQLSRSYDSIAPTVTVTTTSTNPTRTSPIYVTVTFSEAVSGFVIGDIVVGNGTASSFVAVSAAVYTLEVTPTSQGLVTVDLAAGVAQDNAGNINTAAVRLSRTYDTVSPLVSLTSTAPYLTRTSPITITANFNEAVNGFIVGDVTVSNGIANNFMAVSEAIYTFDVVPVNQGLVAVDIRAGVTQDAAGNGNIAATQLSWTFDNVGATVLLTSTATNHTKTSPIPITATFNEAVTGFVVGDVTVGNGTVGSFEAVSPTVYKFNVTPMNQGLVTVDIQASVAQDSAGNSNTAATQLSIIYDTLSPTVMLTITGHNPTNISSFPVKATFNEAVTGFTVGDVTVGNGAAGNFIAVSTTIYTFDVTPTIQGIITIDVAANVAQDSAGNWNDAAVRLSVTYDSVSPTVTLTSTASNPTNISPIPVTATYSEAVSGFVIGDIIVSNCTVSGFVAVSATVYTFNIVPTGDGTVTVDIAFGAAQDAAGNGNTAATQWSRIYDILGATVTLTSTSPDITNTSPIPVTATFSEAVTGFTIEDITVGNGTVANLTAVSLTVYTFNITPSNQGVVTVDIAAGVTQDIVGNVNTASAQLSRIYDNIAPTVSVTSTAPDITKYASIPVKVIFSEPVSDFILSDITIGNGIANNLITESTTVYTFDVIPGSQGAVTIEIAASVALDSAGNENIAALQLRRIYDSIAPILTSARTETIKSITAIFSEDLNWATVNKDNFVVTDNTITQASEIFNGVVILTLETELTPDATPLVTYTRGILADVAGNEVVTSTVTAIDNISPTLLNVHIATNNNAISYLAENGDTVSLTIEASESLQMLNATIAGHVAVVEGAGTSWTAKYTMTPEDTEQIISFNITFIDLAGNTGMPVTSTTDGSCVITVDDGISLPGLTTNEASNITINTANLNGSLDNLGEITPVNVYFEYGMSFGILNNSTPSVSLNTAGTFSAHIIGLTYNTKYYFRVKAVIGRDTYYGQRLSFTTSKVPFIVTTNSATFIGTSSATLNGNLVSLGDYNQANVFFKWGTNSDALNNVVSGLLIAPPVPAKPTGWQELPQDIQSASSINYYFPDGWVTNNDLPQPTIIQAQEPSTFPGTVLRVYDVAEGTTNAQLREYIIASYPSNNGGEYENFVVVDEGDITLDDGIQTVYLIFKGTLDDTNIESIAVFLMRGTLGFVLIGSDYPDTVFAASQVLLTQIIKTLHSSSPLSIGPFSVAINGLIPNTTYYFQAAATATDEGGQTCYGEEKLNFAPSALVAILSGTPLSITNSTSGDITVGGLGVTQYKYKLDNDDYSTATPVEIHINLTNLDSVQHELLVVGGDLANNWQSEESATAYIWTVDTTPPTVTGLSNDTTAKKSKTWTWSSEEGATFHYAIDQSASGIPTGSYGSTTTATRSNGDGICYIHVQAKDIAGNESVIYTASAILDNTVTVTGLSNDITPRKSKTWTWSSEDGATFRYIVDQSATGTPTGTYGSSTIATQANGDGTYYIHVQAKDRSGNESAVYTVSAILDNTAPTVTGLSDDTTPGKTKTWTWSSEDGATFRYVVDQSATGAPTGTYGSSTIATQANGDGIYYIHVQAKDRSGNESAIYTVSAILDSIATVTGLSNDTTARKSKTWTWSSEDGATFRYIIDQSATGIPTDIYSSITTATQATGNGTYYIHVQAKDILGNESTVCTVSAILDNIATVTGLSNDTTLRKSKTWTWSSETGATFRYTIDQNTTWAPTDLDLYAATATATQSTGNGTYYIHVQAKDTLDNVSDIYTASAVLDNTAPIVTGLSNDTTAKKSKTWTWSSEDGATFRYIIDQSATGTPTGSYGSIITATQSTGNGTYYIHVQAKDITGNESTVYSASVILSNIPPAVTTASATNISASTVTLNGNLTSMGDYSPVSVYFLWWTTDSVNSPIATTSTSKSATGAFTANIGGLSANTIYYFEAVSEDSNQTVKVYGLTMSFTTSQSSSSSSGGGGGGGGGGSGSSKPTPTHTPTQTATPTPLPTTPTPVTINNNGTESSMQISSAGVVTQAVTSISTDKEIGITIQAGDIVLTKEGKPPTSIKVEASTNPPMPPTDKNIIGLTYTFEPSGLTFNPPMTLVWSYDTAALKKGTNEKDLRLSFYNTATNSWETVTGDVDTVNHKITAKVAHFTTFAVIASLPIQETTPTISPTSEPALAPTPEISPTLTEAPDNGGHGGGGIRWWMLLLIVLGVFVVLAVLWLWPPPKKSKKRK